MSIPPEGWTLARWPPIATPPDADVRSPAYFNAGVRRSALLLLPALVGMPAWAEHVLTGRRPRQIDQEIGFAIVSRVDPALGAAFAGSEHRDGHRAVDEVLGMYVIDDEEIKREVDCYYHMARESLSAVWRAVDHVAQALLKHEELNRDGLDEALGDADVYRLVFAVQEAHGLRRATALVAT